jgi:hypothetical protein
MPLVTLKPVFREWALGGCFGLGLGANAMIWAAVAGPRSVGDGIVYCVVFAGLTAGLTIWPSLRNMEVPAEAPPKSVIQTTAGATLLLQFASLCALLGVAAAVAPGVMFRLGLLGLLLGVLWLGAAAVVRYREVHRFHGRLVVAKHGSRFRAQTTSFYIVPD